MARVNLGGRSQRAVAKEFKLSRIMPWKTLRYAVPLGHQLATLGRLLSGGVSAVIAEAFVGGHVLDGSNFDVKAVGRGVECTWQSGAGSDASDGCAGTRRDGERFERDCVAILPLPTVH